jgi:hypothetical protein
MCGSELEFDITKPTTNKVVCKKEFTLFQINIFLSTARFTKKGRQKLHRTTLSIEKKS